MADTYDMIVVGTGWFGLAAARAYIEMHPNQKILVLESESTCGGTWSQDRIYPGLKSNNMKGTYEYPDFPMKEEVYGVRPGQHIPGAILHQYLTDYSKQYGIFERTRFNTRANVIEPSQSGGWLVDISTPSKIESISTAKLILATGLTSIANFPQYDGKDVFGAPYFHAKDFCREAPGLKDVKQVTIVGAGKSAFDIAYAFVEDGATVDLIIRPDGQGPIWLAPPYVTPLKRWLEKLLQTRFLTWFSPCPWGAEDKYPGPRNFLHGTAFGRMIVDAFWWILGSDVLSANGYDRHPELKKLKPWNSVFWIGTGLSINNYPTDFFSIVKEGKVRVHITEVDHLEEKKVFLKNDEVLDADVLVCATGWTKEPSLKFNRLGDAGIGLPHSLEVKIKLNNEADAQILSMYPRLKDQPSLNFEQNDADPLRLYRFIVPPTMVSTRNLAFAGMVSTINTSTCATIQALWISAFLDGKLNRVADTEEEVTEEVMIHTQWGKWRYPCGYGASVPDMVFEALPYVDLLLNDLGLTSHRKGGHLAELFRSYGPEDYVDLTDELKHTHLDS